MTETRYKRIAREQAERQAAREQREKLRAKLKAYVKRRPKLRDHYSEIEAEYMLDSFDPPEPPEF